MPSQRAHIKRLIEVRKLASAYGEAGYEDRADRVSACGKTYSFYVCTECGQFCYLQEYQCGDRLCPLCARRRVARLLQNYGGLLKGLKAARMVTVSLPSKALGQLHLAVKELWNAFTRLRHRAIWKVVRGAIASLEITFNPKDKTWHPHLHVVVDSEFIPWIKLREAWREVTGGLGQAVYIQKCRRGWHRELIKYVTKVADLMKSPEALREFYKWSRNKRFIRTYGTLYNAAVEKEELHHDIRCRGCGAVMKLEKQCCTISDVYGEAVSFVIDNRAGPRGVSRYTGRSMVQGAYA